MSYSRINEHRRETLAIIVRAQSRLTRRQWRNNTLMIWSLFTRSLEVEPDGAGLPCVVQAAREVMRPL